MQRNRKFLILHEKSYCVNYPNNKLSKGPIKHYFHLHPLPNKFSAVLMSLHVVHPSINSWHDLLFIDLKCKLLRLMSKRTTVPSFPALREWLLYPGDDTHLYGNSVIAFFSGTVIVAGRAFCSPCFTSWETRNRCPKVHSNLTSRFLDVKTK